MTPLRRFLVSALPIVALLLPLSARASGSLPRGDDHFQLGMSRAALDSAIVARGDTVISNGTAFLVCSGTDPGVQYVQYSFFRAPHGMGFLWRVTVGYRLDATRADYLAARDQLIRLLGDPQTGSWQADDDTQPAEAHPADAVRVVAWGDDETGVSLGGRWSQAPDSNADRMLITWVDRRLQRLVVAGRKKEKTPK